MTHKYLKIQKNNSLALDGSLRDILQLNHAWIRINFFKPGLD